VKNLHLGSIDRSKLLRNTLVDPVLESHSIKIRTHIQRSNWSMFHSFTKTNRMKNRMGNGASTLPTIPHIYGNC